MNRWLINLIFLSAVFPFFRFFPGINAEVQPFGGLVACMMLLRYGMRKDLASWLACALIGVLSAYVGVGLLRGIEFTQVILLYVAYVMPLATFLALRKHGHKLSPVVPAISLAVNFLVGLLQWLGAFGWAEPVLKVLISRTGEELTANRGVPLLTPEPSYGAYSILLCTASIVYFFALGRVGRRTLLFALVLCAFLLFVNKSGNALTLILLLGAGYVIARIWTGTLVQRAMFATLLTVMITVVWIGSDYLVSNMGVEARALDVLQVAKAAVTGQATMKSGSPGLELLVELGGKRYVTVLVGYLSLLDTYGMGHGVASYILDYARIRDAMGIDLSEMTQLRADERIATVLKPDSYGGTLTMDSGLPGLMCLLAILMSCLWRINRLRRWTPNQRGSPHCWTALALWFVAAYMLLAYVSTAMPAPWVLLAMAFYLTKADANIMPTRSFNVTSGFTENLA